jgi:HK97 family phage major capsid protein
MASQKLLDAQAEIGEKHKTISTVLEEAGKDYDFTKVKALGDKLDTQAKVEKFRELNTELTDLTDKCKRLEFEEIGENVRKVGEMRARPADPGVHADPGDQGTKSLGTLFTESPAYKSLRDNRSDPAGRRTEVAVEFADMSLKTLMQTQAGWAPEATRTGRIVDAVTRPIQVLDLIPGGQTTQNSIVYMEETTRTHSAVEVAEAQAYAEDAYELTERSSPVRKIGTSLPVTDEQLEDEAQVRSYIDGRMRFGVTQRLDSQVIVGNGTSPNLRGVLNVAGIQTQAKGADPTFDAFHKAMTKVRVTGRATPNAIVIHPNDWEAIRLTRTADGIYILGNPSVTGAMTLFGLAVTLADLITENTGLVGDFANYCQLSERRGVEVKVGFVNTQFTTGQQTIRADLRVGFVVYRPSAFCTVTGI